MKSNIKWFLDYTVRHIFYHHSFLVSYVISLINMPHITNIMEKRIHGFGGVCLKNPLVAEVHTQILDKFIYMCILMYLEIPGILNLVNSQLGGHVYRSRLDWLLWKHGFVWVNTCSVPWCLQLKYSELYNKKQLDAELCERVWKDFFYVVPRHQTIFFFI